MDEGEGSMKEWEEKWRKQKIENFKLGLSQWDTRYIKELYSTFSLSTFDQDKLWCKMIEEELKRRD